MTLITATGLLELGFDRETHNQMDDGHFLEYYFQIHHMENSRISVTFGNASGFMVWLRNAGCNTPMKYVRTVEQLAQLLELYTGLTIQPPKTVRQAHDEAMEIADTAFTQKRLGNDAGAVALFVKACDLESFAAQQVPNDPESEPTRSILFLSAGSLAFNGQQMDRAKQLFEMGLNGHPLSETKLELENMLAQTQEYQEQSGVALITKERFAEVLLNFSISPHLDNSERALAHLLSAYQDKFVGYEARSFHKMFRQLSITGSEHTDMAIWYLLQQSKGFWLAFHNVFPPDPE